MRRTIPTLVLAAGLLASAAPVAAQTDPAAAPAAAPIAAAPAPKDPRDEVICRNLTLSGSHLKRYLCQTRREWAQLTADGRHYMEAVQNAAAFGTRR